MSVNEVVESHVMKALYASILESEVDNELCQRLQARTKLRMMNMSDEELWDLALMTATPPERPVDQLFQHYWQTREHYREVAATLRKDLAQV